MKTPRLVAEATVTPSRCGAGCLSIAVLALVGLGCCQPAAAQPIGHRAVLLERLWQDFDSSPGVPSRNVTAERQVRLDIDAVRQLLTSVPRAVALAPEPTGAEMWLPVPGGIARLRVVESPVLEQGLAGRFPDIRTFRGRGIDDPTLTARFSWTPDGIHAVILSEHGTYFIAPVERGDDRRHFVFDARKLPPRVEPFEEVPVTSEEARPLAVPVAQPVALASPVPVQLRTYRLAVAATAEYTNLFRQAGDDDQAAKQRALLAIVQMVNLVGAIYERDLAVSFQLVAGELDIIFTDPIGDPYTNGTTSLMLKENKATLDVVIGVTEYDTGHVFGTNSGGQGDPAGQVCVDTLKGRGATGLADPNDPAHVLVVAHEFGHQFGGSHTFNGTAPLPNGDPDCGPARFSDSAYEPGSGTSILSYAGGCGVQNTQPDRDGHFHWKNIEQITSDLATKACGISVTTANHQPTVDAGADYAIPKQTPFELTATASDPDDDAITYTWDEYDLGMESPPDNDADGNPRPILRGYAPTTSPSRTFPSLVYVLEHGNVPPTNYELGGVTYLVAETLPAISRTMTFRVTVRDNNPAAGGVATDVMQLVVDGNSGPFAVTSPSDVSVVWTTGASQTVAWDVAGTSGAPVSCADVRILLSSDGGLTFPFVLAAETPNDGSEIVAVPDLSTGAARVKVQCADNVFFDISNEDFRVNRPPTIVCPANLTVPTDPGVCSAMVVFAPTVTDDEPGAVYTCSPASGSAISKGTSTVLCTATDVRQATASCSFQVTVVDTEPPAIAGLAATPALLWPPNHGLVPVDIGYAASDNCAAASSLVCSLAVSSSEPVNGLGDGDRAPDWVLADRHSVWLRSERGGGGSGRTYTNTVTCTDDSSNTASASVPVLVPHER